MIAHWRNPALRAAFAIGFCILFAFIGTFTFVNFVLVRAPLSLGMMDLGFVYFVFLPSVVTTLFAGKARRAVRHAAGDLGRARRGGHRPAADAVLAPCRGPDRHGAGRLPARSSRRPPPPASSDRPRSDNRGVASGTYLACYFFGGLVGSAVLGQLFDRFGWTACVLGVGAALAIAALLAARLVIADED